MGRFPVNKPYVITTPFGVPDPNAQFKRHSGVDAAVPLNRPVYAPASGTITNIVSPTGGNMVRLFDGTYHHRLMHNNSFSRGNGPVNEGEEVAKAGTTGLSTGVHCHWDIANKAVPTSFSDFINPDVWLKENNMPLATYQEANIYAQEMLFRDMPVDEFNKFHKGKTRDQLFDEFRDAPEREQKLAYWQSLVPTNKQIDETINRLFIAGYGRPATDAEFNNLRPLFKNNYVEANLTVLENTINDPNSLKNKPSGGYKAVGQLYVKE